MRTAYHKRLYELLVQTKGSLPIETVLSVLDVGKDSLESAIKVAREKCLLEGEVLQRHRGRIWIKNKWSKKKRLRRQQQRDEALTYKDVSDWT